MQQTFFSNFNSHQLPIKSFNNEEAYSQGDFEEYIDEEQDMVI